MTDEGRAAGRRTAPGAWFVAAPAIALVVGLLIGGLVVWAGMKDDAARREPTGAGTPSATPSASTGADQGGDDTAVLVPAECLAAADTVEKATGVFEELAGAFRDFQPDRLRELLTQLEDLQNEARSQADACRRVEVTGTALPTPTAQDQ